VLRAFAPDLWIADQALTFVGLHLGTRMTVVRLRDGGLFLHSPIRLTEELGSAIDALGPVRCVVAPNLYHHRFVADYRTAYPKAKLYGAPGLAKKRKDLAFDFELGGTHAGEWADDLDQVYVSGCALCETVFFHRASRTVIAADFSENFTGAPHWPTRLYLRAGGIYQRPGLSRFLRPLFRNRSAARTSIDRILEWPSERAIVAHGVPVEQDARAVLVDTYRWLKA
jgi:hypothetical protein